MSSVVVSMIAWVSQNFNVFQKPMAPPVVRLARPQAQNDGLTASPHPRLGTSLISRKHLPPMAYSFRISPGRCLPKTLKAIGETRSMNEITKKAAAMGRLKKINGLPPEMIRD